MSVQRKTPTIQDVARSAGVSTATVSRALSRPERVSDATRQRVDAAIRVTGYTLNQAGRSLRQHTARTILVALPDIRNPFFSSILDAVEREAASRGFGVLVLNLHLGGRTVQRLHDFLRSNRADGLLLLDGSLDIDQLRPLSAPPFAIPLVLACEDIPQSGLPSVLTDNARAAQRATQHLIELGHRRIGHILGPEANVVARERLAGFQAALAQAGLPLVPDWLFKGSFEMDSGFAVAARYMALAIRPTAVFAANDESAIGFLSGLREHGVHCPNDVSVVGFDDLAVAAHYQPPLTTMRQPREAMGRMAAEALIDLIERPDSLRAPLKIVLNSELVVRGSTGRPARLPSVQGESLDAV